MRLLFADKLSRKQMFDIYVLERQNNYSILQDDDEADILPVCLAYEDASLIGILSLCETTDGYEIDALVDSVYRRQGVFTALVTFAKQHFDPTELEEFPLYVSYSATEAPFDFSSASFCGELMYQDYFMTLDKNDYNIQAANDSCYYLEVKNDCYTLKKATRGRHCIIGNMHLDYQTDFTNVWGVEIRAKYRSQGFGQLMMNMVLNSYFAENSNRLLLHVRNDNEPAVKLYKKLGFKLHRTINNYLV